MRGNELEGIMQNSRKRWIFYLAILMLGWIIMLSFTKVGDYPFLGVLRDVSISGLSACIYYFVTEVNAKRSLKAQIEKDLNEIYTRVALDIDILMKNVTTDDNWYAKKCDELKSNVVRRDDTNAWYRQNKHSVIFVDTVTNCSSRLDAVQVAIGDFDKQMRALDNMPVDVRDQNKQWLYNFYNSKHFKRALNLLLVEFENIPAQIDDNAIYYNLKEYGYFLMQDDELITNMQEFVRNIYGDAS